MVRYFYVWMPFAAVFGTATLLVIPYLAVIALMLVVLGALAALAWATASVTRRFGRAIARGRNRRSGVDRLQERLIGA